MTYNVFGGMLNPTLLLLTNTSCIHLYIHLLRASAMLKHVIDIGWTSVRPFVRLSVCHTLVLYQNGCIYCHAFFTTR